MEAMELSEKIVMKKDTELWARLSKLNRVPAPFQLPLFSWPYSITFAVSGRPTAYLLGTGGHGHLPSLPI